MNYKEKYNKALERARDLMTKQNPPAFDENLISIVFPELKESVDERIKREILELVSIAGNGNQFEKIKNWLEKQGKKDPCIGCTNDKGCVTCIDGNMKDTVTSKFKKGDYIVNSEGKCYKIRGVYTIDGGYYIATDKEGDDNRICFGTANEYFHRWTIQDAKEGDVLASEAGMIILTRWEEKVKSLVTYAYYNLNGIVSAAYIVTGFSMPLKHCDALHPATEEQCDLLFSKLKEVGYEWDAEKKELKKI